jgi:hypothetical protein
LKKQDRRLLFWYKNTPKGLIDACLLEVRKQDNYKKNIAKMILEKELYKSTS